MADRDVVVADQDLAEDESDDFLALLGGEVLGVGAEAGAESFERFGELEVGLGVVQLGVERGELGLQGGLALAQLRGAGTELVERDELLLVSIKQTPERVLGAGEIALQCVTPSGSGVRVAEGGEPSVDLRLDQARVLEQAEHPGPDQLVDLVHADRTVIADSSFRAAVSVGA